MKKQTSNVESLTSNSQRARWHNAVVRREFGGATSRASIGLLVAVMVTACVTISPTPSSTPAPTRVPVTTRPIAQPSTGATATPSQHPPASLCCGAQPPGSVGPGATIDPTLAAQIDAVIAQVPPIRELEPLAAVPYEFISREQFRDELIDLSFSEVPEQTRQAEERMLKRLGLLPDEADLDQLLIDLYGGQVAAFYRPDTKRFYIIQRGTAFGPSDKIIVAHEYTHALQDQHFDLEGTRVKDLSEGDAALGQLGAVEGDATLTMQLWANENLSIVEAIVAIAESLAQLDDPTLANMPPILRRQLEYPYVEGFAFAQELANIGGFDAIDATLSDAIPASTEQILHPDKYLANEEPVVVKIIDAAPALGAGWSTVYEQTMGELLMQVWVAGEEAPIATIPGFPADWPHAETVAGWGGDRLVMYEGPADAWIVVWVSAWDTQADADEFAARAFEVASPLAFGRPTIREVANRVCLAFASDTGLIVDDRLPGLGCP